MLMNRAIAAVLSAALLAFSAAAGAAVADAHAKRGAACESCHFEAPPSAANASEQSCIKCHTETPKGRPVVMDGHEVPNVHAGHFDTYECLQCHKGHKPSVAACAECHKSPLAVP